jgi:23S rRNA (cytidine1920-2'-O)/16S rRNA (cytidine1409-2'-O)-methyltransferase
VIVSGAVAEKSARLVSASEPVEVRGPPARFVSRGGDKLDAALDHFSLDVAGWRAVDAGASTGGFTDCLLQRGAAAVYAIDVGHGQLHPRIRNDARVLVHERTNVRTLDPKDLDGKQPFSPVDLVVADLSFISLRTVAAALVGLARDGGSLVLLVKPQFEAGRAAVSKGKGVVSDPALWLEALQSVTSTLEHCGTGIMGAMASPLTGAAGNAEFLIHSVKGAGTATPLDALLAGAVAEVTGSHG